MDAGFQILRSCEAQIVADAAWLSHGNLLIFAEQRSYFEPIV